MRFKSKIRKSEQIEKALAEFDKSKIQKLKPGFAKGATLDGSVCATLYGSSEMSRATVEGKIKIKKARQDYKKEKIKEQVSGYNNAKLVKILKETD